MTTTTSIVNRALQAFGSRTTVTDAELAAGSTNEAIQANLILTSIRDQLLRMAPWDCAMDTVNLAYITSAPGTPENTSPMTPLWEKGQPSPPWLYEYQYPVDCLRACWIIPATQTGFGTSVPLTSAASGSNPVTWLGLPVKYKVQVDQFYPVTAAAVSAAGSGYVIGDLITLEQADQGDVPVGAPVVLRVLTVAATAILTVAVVNQISGAATPQGGSYFLPQTGAVAQGSTTGVGTGATFTLTFGSQGSQRVILTNQEYATLVFIKQVTDPNIMDPLFIDAWVEVLGAYLCIALSGDKSLANSCIAKANVAVAEARKADGNEGLTTNDVTPDWIRTRGIAFDGYYSGPYSPGWDWGPSWAAF
jgi:hypothetical protein